MADKAPAGTSGADPLSVPAPVLSSLLASAGHTSAVARRDPLHVWAMSAVERIHLDNGATVILKTAVEPFTQEAETLQHAASHYVPVPAVLGTCRLPGEQRSMLLEDLGPQPDEDLSLNIGAAAAVAVHRCPTKPDLPTLDAVALATLPIRAAETLTALEMSDRWPDSSDIHRDLRKIAKVAHERVRLTDTPPYGMCHSEFHPTSLIEHEEQAKILDWARAFTGPGLLDLASWQDTPQPLDTTAIAFMISEYVTAGGSENAFSSRGGLPAEVWAGGWHRMWISTWYLQQCLRWMPDPANDIPTQRTVRRHLAEAVDCLV